MVDELYILLDGQYRGSIPNEFGIQVQFDTSTHGVFTTFENDVTLSGESYAYLFDIYLQNDYCREIEVTAIYTCSGYDRIVIATGIIFVSDCLFDRDKCQLTTIINDDGFQTRINNNKSIPIFSNSALTKNLDVIAEPFNSFTTGGILTPQATKMFIPSTGNYINPDQFAYGWTVFNAFKISIAFMSDNSVGFVSDYFLTGEGKQFMIVSGASIRTGKTTPFEFTFENIYSSLNKKIQLGFGFEKIDGVPFIRIEKLEYYRNQPASVTLLDVPDIKSRFDKSKIWATISLGSEQGEFLEEWQGRNETAVLSFPQVAFRGFKRETFGLTGNCNLDSNFDLVTNKLIFDTNIIEDVLIYDNQNFDKNPFLIELPFYIGQADTVISVAAESSDILGIGTFQYNKSFVNDQQAQNNINGVPSSIWQYYQGLAPTAWQIDNSGPNPAPPSTLGDHEMELDGTLREYSSSTDPDPVTGAFGTGHYVEFTDQTINPNGFYETPQTYVVPAPGIYTVTADIWRRAPINAPFAAVGAIISWFIVIRRTTAQNEILHDYASVQFTGFGNTDQNETHSKTFFANEGDFIVINIFAETSIQPAWFSAFSLISLGEVQSFIGSGEPFQGGELQPYDPGAFRPVIDTFKYPLSFAQIMDIVNNTRGSIAYSDSTDVTSVKLGDILRITIPSLMNNPVAEFQLKTNTL